MTEAATRGAGIRELLEHDLPEDVRGVLLGGVAKPIFTSERLEYFKWDSYRNIFWWRDQCEFICRRLGPGGIASILFPVFDSNLGGLNVDDIGVLLQPWLHTQRIVEIEGARKWIVAEVSVRYEYIAFLLRVEPNAPALRSLNLLWHLSVKQMILGLPLSWIARVRSGGSLRWTALAKLAVLARSGAQLAICIDRLPKTSQDQSNIVYFRDLLSRNGVASCGVIFGWNVVPSEFDYLDQILAQSRFSFVSTFRGDIDVVPQGPAEYGVRIGSYFRTGSYYPLETDRRVARPIRPADQDVELIRDDMRGVTDVVAWANRRAEAFGEQPAAMAGLFDYKRREKYMLTLPQSEMQGQWFNEFAPHNWKREAERTRLFCAEIGSIEDPQINETIAAALQMMDRRPWLRLVPPGELSRILRDVADSRSLPDVAAAKEVQCVEHAYLADNPSIGLSLPKNIQAFADFIPREIGSALEIGVGYGALAVSLADRSSSYVCVDLSAEGLRGFLSATTLPLVPIVADAHALPFPDGIFDTVIANNVIEHFYEPLAGLVELRRVLRTGGLLQALIPLDALNPRVTLPAHLWKADLFGVERLINSAGFTINRIEVFDANLVGTPGCFASCRGLHVLAECVS